MNSAPKYSRATWIALFCSICLLISAQPLSAQEPPPPSEFFKNLPKNLVLKCGVPYASDPDLYRNQLDIIYHADTSVKRPAIVAIHGGAWLKGEKENIHFQAMTRYFAEQGHVACTINYRLTDAATFPAQIVDCKTAVRWLRANADEYGIDTEQIGAIGVSAGGHLTALLAVTKFEDGLDDKGPHQGFSSAVQAAVPICAPFILNPDSEAVQLLLGNQPAAIASPISYVSADDAPMLIIHGTKDELVSVDQAYTMDKALKKAGVPHTTLILEGATHSNKLWDWPGTESKAYITRFFDKYLK